MDEGILGVLLPIIISLGAFVMVVYLRKYENAERLAIIEKGLEKDLFKRSSSPSGALRAALLFIGAGIGLLLGYWLNESFDMRETGYFAMLMIFGGIGLGIAYLIEESKAKSLR